MVLHLASEADASSLHLTVITSVSDSVSYLIVSDDSDRILVVYDYQDCGGNSDLEDIPDAIKAGVLCLDRIEVMRESDAKVRNENEVE